MKNRRSLELEELAQRILPSVSRVPFASLSGTQVMIAVQQHAQNPLCGHGQGTYTGNISFPDTGVNNTLQGTAKLARLGDVTVAGSVHGVGFIASGHATGTLTFTNGQGSVTLDLLGPEQPGFSSLPKEWKYTVTGATGDYQNLMGQQGSLKLTFQADTSATSPQGTFTLKI